MQLTQPSRSAMSREHKDSGCILTAARAHSLSGSTYEIDRDRVLGRCGSGQKRRVEGVVHGGHQAGLGGRIGADC